MATDARTTDKASSRGGTGPTLIVLSRSDVGVDLALFPACPLQTLLDEFASVCHQVPRAAYAKRAEHRPSKSGENKESEETLHLPPRSRRPPADRRSAPSMKRSLNSPTWISSPSARLASWTGDRLT